MPSGEPTSACNRLFLNCKEKGLHIVEVGELEGFARSVGSHGPKWANSVLEKDLLGALSRNRTMRIGKTERDIRIRKVAKGLLDGRPLKSKGALPALKGGAGKATTKGSIS